MQRFVPQSRFIISQNDYTRSTQRTIHSCFGAFHSARVHLGMFHYGSKLGAKRAEVVQLMQKFVPRSHIRIFRNKRARSTHWILNSCFRVFLSVWVHLGLFHCCIKLGAKPAELVRLLQKFVPRSRIEIFRNECTRSTPLDPILMFCCVS